MKRIIIILSLFLIMILSGCHNSIYVTNNNYSYNSYNETSETNISTATEIPQETIEKNTIIEEKIANKAEDNVTNNSSNNLNSLSESWNKITGEKLLKYSYFEDENIIRRENTIEKCNTVSGTITKIGKFVTGYIEIKNDELKKVSITAWLKDKDIEKLDVGDYVTIRGDIRYTTPTSEFWPHFISVGGSFDKQAKIVSYIKGK